jgi:preprotein translocase subunit SecA
MDHLREGIGLRGYAQKNPLYEYQKEGFVLFQQMLEEMKESVVRKLFYYNVPRVEEVIAHFEQERRRHEEQQRAMTLQHGGESESEGDESEDDAAVGGVKSPDDQRARLEAQRKERRKERRKASKR